METYRIDNDVNGNPRYCIHFLALLRDGESSQADAMSIARKRANNLGGMPYRGRKFCGMFVFKSYNLDALKREIEEEKEKEDIDVVFRKFKDDGSIIALFISTWKTPSVNVGHVMSYQHVGQHGEADPSIIRGVTVAAKPEECGDLARELRSIGYRLRVMKRFQWNRA